MPATRPRIAHGASADGTRRTDRVESCSPADGIGAAVKERDFGTSRRQLADQCNVRARSIWGSPHGQNGPHPHPKIGRGKREEWTAAASYFTSFTPVTASRFL